MDHQQTKYHPALQELFEITIFNLREISSSKSLLEFPVRAYSSVWTWISGERDEVKGMEWRNKMPPISIRRFPFFIYICCFERRNWNIYDICGTIILMILIIYWMGLPWYALCNFFSTLRKCVSIKFFSKNTWKAWHRIFAVYEFCDKNSLRGKKAACCVPIFCIDRFFIIVHVQPIFMCFKYQCSKQTF